MVRLDRTARDLECTLVAKLELFNPGGSSKDRIALAMIEAAERDGRAPAGRDDRGAHQRQHRRRARHRGGAARLQLHLRLPRQGGAGEDRPAAGLRRRGRRLSRRRSPRTIPSPTTRCRTGWPGRSRWRGSPTSTTTPTTPRRSTRRPGPEIWEQTRGRVTHFVAGIGTGGTVTGIGRYLKERNPAVQIIGADPDGSVYSGGSGRPVSGRGHRRGLLAVDLRPLGRRPGGGDLRRAELRHGPAGDARGGPAPRRLGGDRHRRRPGGGPRPPPRRRDRGAHPRLGAGLSVQDLQRRLDGRLRLPPGGGDDRGRPPGGTRPVAPVARPHPSRRDGAPGHRHPARVRRQPDAGGQARATGGAGRGGGRRHRTRPHGAASSPTPPCSSVPWAT